MAYGLVRDRVLRKVVIAGRVGMLARRAWYSCSAHDQAPEWVQSVCASTQSLGVFQLSISLSPLQSHVGS
jgi:hypothetical protein